MNCLKQLENGIFATEADLLALKKRKNARLLVFSDSHGDHTVVSDIFRQFGSTVDAAIFAGDGLYDVLHTMNNAAKYSDAMKNLPPVICMVRGNNDTSYLSSDFLEDIFIPRRAVLTVGARTILVTHGNESHVYYSTDAVEMEAEITGANSVIYGHSHVPAENMHVIYSMNPGSCSYPRRRSPRSCAVLEIQGRNIFSIFYSIETGIKTKFIPYHPERLIY